MKICWDPLKAQAKFQKHRVRFSEAELVLFDPTEMTREDVVAEEEQRFVTIGRGPLDRILVVVYTYREEEIRMISARRATPRERRSYEEGI